MFNQELRSFNMGLADKLAFGIGAKLEGNSLIQ